MLPREEYEELRLRPDGAAAMLQSWRDLLFLHISVEPSAVQALLPEELTVDTFPGKDGEERAWIGLVPFHMLGIRPRSLPAAPWLSAFPETNVRTYVHHEGNKPGVWFFSLDAARWIACRYARMAFCLPYYHALMKRSRSGNLLSYESRRREGKKATLEIRAKVGDPIPQPEFGSLEFFLVERYLLYALKGSRLFTGRVYHTPYSLRKAEVVSCSQTLVETETGFRCDRWDHVCFSEGVDVEVFGIGEGG